MTNRGVVALTGRTEECRFLDAAWSGGRGVVLAGVQGVGKTRLAREFLAERERAGVPTDWISGVSGLSEVPLAPFLSFGADMGTVVAQLTPPTGSRKVVVVDDGQLLDALSAEVVHRMSVTNGVFLVVTLLAGEPVPAAVTSLWKDGLLDRLELQALSKNQTQEMVESAVGGEIDGMTAQAVWNVTRGNPLFIGELVIAGRDRGALVQAGGTWRWRPELPLGGRLQEVVGGRLGRLGAEENATLELIAAAGWLELDVLEGLAAPGTIETLERAGLIVVDRAGRRLTARTSHPIHLELVREKLPASRSRALRSLLASAVSTRGMRRRGDAVRVASWQLDTPAPPEPAVLLAAARAAPWAFTQALSEQLSGLAHPSQHRMITPRLRGEDELQAALRLALAAWELFVTAT